MSKTLNIPVTTEFTKVTGDPVELVSGETLSTSLGKIAGWYDSLGGGSSITIDPTITENSTNPVQSSAIYASLSNKLDASVVDASGSSGSSGWYNCRLYNGQIQYYNTNTGIISPAYTSEGGTGRTSLTMNAVLTGNGGNGSQCNLIETTSGAFYATSSGGAAQFGTLPVAQGGTGVTTLDDLKTSIGMDSVINVSPTTIAEDQLDSLGNGNIFFVGHSVAGSTGSIFDGADWTGIQIGTTNNRFQLVSIYPDGRELLFRANDTNAEWTSWKYIAFKDELVLTNSTIGTTGTQTGNAITGLTISDGQLKITKATSFLTSGSASYTSGTSIGSVTDGTNSTTFYVPTATSSTKGLLTVSIGTGGNAVSGASLSSGTLTLSKGTFLTSGSATYSSGKSIGSVTDGTSTTTFYVPNASTSATGVVQLTESTSSTSTTTAATPNSVRTAYMLASGKPSQSTITASAGAATSSITSQSITQVGNIVVGNIELKCNALSANSKVDLLTGLPTPSAARSQPPIRLEDATQNWNIWITAAGQCRFIPTAAVTSNSTLKINIMYSI